MKNKLNETDIDFGNTYSSMPKSDSSSSSEQLKGGEKKMRFDIQSKVSEYSKLITAIKEQFDEPAEVLAVLQEICKDMRVAEMKQEKIYNSDLPATEKQIAYLKNYGAIVTKNVDIDSLTKQQASNLIGESEKIRAELQKAFKKPIKIQEFSS
jgi:esterase/lipase